MTKLKFSDLFFLLLCSLAIVSYLYLAAPNIKKDSTLFSIEKAQDHLNKIASEPHPIGTEAHIEVSRYIKDFIQDHAYEYKNQQGIIVNNWGGMHRIVSINNHLALHKGTNSDGIVVFVAHYDSQPNTPGAADDGAPVSAMLDLMEKLDQQSHENDILFLFTDGEEMGLNGAKYFVENYARKQEIKYVFNFEARGNKGPVLAFETTENNNSIIKDLAGMKHVFASSLMYEVYRLLPNDSDFTYFKEMDIAGINFAMIDGFVNYHSMTDTPENLSPSSHYHHGVLMAQLIEKYKNGNLSQEHSHDLSYFNVFGSGIVWYKTFWNLILWILSLILFVFYIRQNKEIKLSSKTIVSAILSTIGILVLVIVGTMLLNFLILKMYPHYSNYYSSNFYNGPIYLLPFMGLCLLTTVGALRWLNSKNESLGQGIHYTGITIFLILGLISYQMVTSGANLFIVPVFTYLSIQNIQLLISKKSHVFGVFLASIIPVILFIPLLYLFFVAFSLSNPFISIFLFSLLIFLIYPVFLDLNRAWMWLFFGMLVMGIMRAHGVSSINVNRPYQVQMYHHTDHTLGESHLISRDKKIDFFEKSFMKTPEMRLINPLDSRERLSSKTDLSFTNPLKFTIIRDTFPKTEFIRIQLQSDSEVIATRIRTADINEMQINGKVISSEKKIYAEYIGGITQDTLTIGFEQLLGDKTKVFITTIERGLIEKLDTSKMIIPGPNNAGGAIMHSTTLEF